MGLWQNSLLPETLKNAPPLLAGVLDRAAGLPERPGSAVAAVISAEFPGARAFSLPSKGGGEGETLMVLSGYYREKPGLALVMFPEGRVLAAAAGQEPPAFALPALPQGFVYTGIGLAGEVLAASWEEQQDSAVGSAGFMVLNAGTLSGVLPRLP
jgi:hypothetical protein